jgi:hypothetical protein
MRRAALACLALLLLAGCSNTPVTPTSPAPTATPARVTTTPPRTTTPAPEPVAPAETFQGSGDDVVDLATPIDELGLMTFSCSSCDSNVIVESDAEYDNTLINAIGEYTGQHWLNPRGTTTSRFQVQADGDWTLTAGGFDDRLIRHAGTQPVQGTGDTVFFLLVAPDTAAFTHDGSSNFVVEVLADSVGFPDLAINEIGAYEGTVLFRVDGSEPALVQVTADGAWTMTPQ